MEAMFLLRPLIYITYIFRKKIIQEIVFGNNVSKHNANEMVFSFQKNPQKFTYKRKPLQIAQTMVV